MRKKQTTDPFRREREGGASTLSVYSPTRLVLTLASLFFRRRVTYVGCEITADAKFDLWAIVPDYGSHRTQMRTRAVRGA